MTAPSRSEIEQELKISLSVQDLERVFKEFSFDVPKGDISIRPICKCTRRGFLCVCSTSRAKKASWAATNKR